MGEHLVDQKTHPLPKKRVMRSKRGKNPNATSQASSSTTPQDPNSLPKSERKKSNTIKVPSSEDDTVPKSEHEKSNTVKVPSSDDNTKPEHEQFAIVPSSEDNDFID